MKDVDVISERVGDCSYTRVSNSNLVVTLEQIGSTKSLTTYGRGNVRQMKAIARWFHKSLQ